jgi:hypothetical protein
MVRLAQRRREADDGYTPELKLGPEWLNGLLETPLRSEAKWLARGGTLPAGLSLLAVLENAGGAEAWASRRARTAEVADE